MKNILIATLALALAAAIPALALAQTGGSYDLTWYTIDNGGGTAVGSGSPNPYILNGTVGQPDAGAWSGGGYVLVGGFWGGAGLAGPPLPYHIYLPLVMRNP